MRKIILNFLLLAISICGLCFCGCGPTSDENSSETNQFIEREDSAVTIEGSEDGLGKDIWG